MTVLPLATVLSANVAVAPEESMVTVSLPTTPTNDALVNEGVADVLRSYSLLAAVMPEMVSVLVVTVKLCDTSVAAVNSVLPAWLAVMVHVPVLITVTVVPDTVHTLVVADAKVTVSADDAVADTVKGETPYTRSANAPNVMVCDDWFTANTASAEVTDETAPDEPEFFTTTEYVPASVVASDANANELDVAPEMFTPFLRHW